jgi:cyclase
MPLASGGHITTLQDIEDRLLRGADKVVIGSEAFKNANFLTAAIRTFGSQCIVVAVDVRKEKNDYSIYVDNGSKMIGENLANCINKFNELEVGELLLTSINRDGTKIGFDIELIEMVASIARVPLIVCGGAGKWEDFESILRIENVDAVAAANIFQHIDQSVYLAHQYLYTKGLNVRKPQLMR